MAISTPEAAPRNLSLSVALIAAAMLLVEIFVTRIFSVLFFYHYSFFAISLIMSGLAFGGLIASRWNVRSMSDSQFQQRLSACAFIFSGGLILAAGAIIALSRKIAMTPTGFGSVTFQAICFLPGLIAGGAFLATAFARRSQWINQLYAWDLIAAALACLASIFLMRTIPGVSTLLVPALLAGAAGLIAGPSSRKGVLVGRALCFCALGALVFNAASGWRLATLQTAAGFPIFSRWNEHSRILVVENPEADDVRHEILIDKAAAALLPKIADRPKGAPLPIEPWWGKGEGNLPYRIGRPVENAAIIGVGGGLDVIGALAHGAKHVDAYELNQIIIDYLSEELPAEKSIAHWPEVSLIHGEGRVGIARSGKKYGVIQASLLDTWAATASGGFVLSENGLYTIDGWRILIGSLSESGVLAMTRLFMIPAETYRMTVLAIEALEEQGVQNPADHIILAGPDFRKTATIIVSKTPYSAEELEHVRTICLNEGLNLLCFPGVETRDPVLRDLLNPQTRAKTIAQSEFDLSVPTDLRPYFFLLLKPLQIFMKDVRRDEGIHEVTMNGIRVLMILSAISVLLAIGVFMLGWFLPGGTSEDVATSTLQKLNSVYFLAIGLGYILVQLGLHQRLTLILGHPTFTLSVVLFAMLLGTGIGSACSGRLFPIGTFGRAWAAILATIIGVILCFSLLPMMDKIDSLTTRIMLSGLLVGVVGFPLGFGFPLGVRLAAPAGEWAVQRMWAINGAASIAGSALAAIIAVTISSRANIIAGLAVYTIAMMAGRAAEQILNAKSSSRKTVKPS